MAHIKKYKYSEIFGNTIQGEGQYTGVPTVWVRFWGCNFECSGFSQDDPTNPSSWILDHQTVDVSSIKRMEDLPVFNRGCDSSYSWAKKFAHLAHQDTAEAICDKLENFLKSKHNPEGKFLHPKSGQWTHMAFTGGEPMMSQNGIVDIMLEFARRGNMPKYVTVETNGTQVARDKFKEYITGVPGDTVDIMQSNDYSELIRQSFYMHELAQVCSDNMSDIPPEARALRGVEWFWSVSPKLFLSGEKWNDAIKPEIVETYKNLSDYGQLKYVCDGSERAWDEVEKATKLYRDVGVNWPVFIMPVGATAVGQQKIQAKVAEEAISRGYNVAVRVHCFLFDNVIGK